MCDIVSYIIIADSSFVRIFTFELILKHREDEDGQLDQEENTDMLRRRNEEGHLQGAVAGGNQILDDGDELLGEELAQFEQSSTVQN